MATWMIMKWRPWKWQGQGCNHADSNGNGLWCCKQGKGKSKWRSFRKKNINDMKELENDQDVTNKPWYRHWCRENAGNDAWKADKGMTNRWQDDVDEESDVDIAMTKGWKDVNERLTRRLCWQEVDDDESDVYKGIIKCWQEVNDRLTNVDEVDKRLTTTTASLTKGWQEVDDVDKSLMTVTRREEKKR